MAQNIIRNAVSIIALCAASPGMADVTATDVWAHWSENLSLDGSDRVSIGSVDTTGNVVTVRDMTYTYKNGDAVIINKIGPVVFKGNTDGTVNVVLPQRQVVTFLVENSGPDQFEITHDNMTILVSGDPDVMVYDVTADGLTLRMTGLETEADMSADILTTFSGLSSQYQSDIRDGFSQVSRVAADDITVEMDLIGVDTREYAHLQMRYTDLKAASTIVVPDDIDLENPQTILGSALDIALSLSMQSNGGQIEAGFVDGHVTGTFQGGDLTANLMLDAQKASYDFGISGMEMAADFQGVEKTDSGRFTYTLGQAGGSLSGYWPDTIDFENPQSLLLADAGVSIAMGLEDLSADVVFQGDDASGTLSMGFDRLATTQKFTTARIDYGFDVSGGRLMADTTEIPDKIETSWDRGEMALSFPARKSADPQDFSALVALTNVVMSDSIWDEIDPAGIFPRGISGVEIETTGTVNLLTDLLDLETLPYAAAIAEIVSLQVNKMHLHGLGGDVAGTADFIFDNTDTTTFQGLPRPEGTAHIVITGVQSLIDTAVDAGIIGPNEATMGRMVLGMFTVPTGEDQLTSEIEINQQGHVMANGQRIQ